MDNADNKSFETTTNGAMRALRIDPSASSQAYERRLAEILATPADSGPQINFDLNAAIVSIYGAVPKVNALRQSIAAIGFIDQSLIDGLEEYTAAADEACQRSMISLTPSAEILALNEEALELRETLRIAAGPLARAGIFNEAQLEPFKHLVGYKNVAVEVAGYATLFIEHWEEIKGRTTLTKAEIDHAKNVGDALKHAAGARERGPAKSVEAVDIRNRAVALMLKAYNEAQRAVVCVRWNEDDADSIVPSLYVKGKRARKEEAGTGTDDDADTEADTEADAAGATPNNGVPVGFPNSSPFTDS